MSTSILRDMLDHAHMYAEFKLYYACSHGGPGSGSGRNARRFFDPEAYRIVLFDQRGAGRSKPNAEIKVGVLRTGSIMLDPHPSV